MKREFKAVEKDLVVEIDIPPRPGPSVYVVAGHRTGSTMLNCIIDDIASRAGLPTIPVGRMAWRAGLSVDDWPPDLYGLLNEAGYVFHTLRRLEKMPDLPAFGAARKLFLIRDPRDVAVSYYFSMAKSHGLPKGADANHGIAKLRRAANEMDIDAFVQEGKAEGVLSYIERFAEYHADPTSVFYRYEDVIFHKREWVADIARQLGADLPAEESDAIADSYDVFPETENPDRHIRSVTPGGYREKLSGETIAFIQERHPVFFNVFGYAEA